MERSKPVVTVKASQKIFTDSEVATLTGICVDHLHNFAKSRHLGFIARAAEAAGLQTDQWGFTLSDLMVLVTPFPPLKPQAFSGPGFWSPGTKGVIFLCERP